MRCRKFQYFECVWQPSSPSVVFIFLSYLYAKGACSSPQYGWIIY